MNQRRRDIMEGTAEKTINTLKAHLALNVSNVAESIEFYKKMLGIEPCKVRTGYAKFDIQNPPLNFTLNEHPGVQKGAVSHLGIQVASTDDVLALREKWQDAGLLPRDEMQTDCCYAVQDKAWVGDPDGNQWEVFVVLEDNLPEKAGASVCCAPVAVEKTEGEAASSSCSTGAETTGAASTCGCSSTVGITR
jgi:catechol 2,3-dioxygenase-like lactoylglutathione lyase family enzyme